MRCTGSGEASAILHHGALAAAGPAFDEVHLPVRLLAQTVKIAAEAVRPQRAQIKIHVRGLIVHKKPPLSLVHGMQKEKQPPHCEPFFPKNRVESGQERQRGRGKMMARCMVVLLFVVVFVALCCFHVSGQD